MTNIEQIESRFPGIIILLNLLIILLLATAGCGGSGAAPDVSALQVSPKSVTLAAGTSQKISVTAVYSNNSSKDVTGSVEFVSANRLIAETDSTGASPGFITGLKQGTTTVAIRDTASGVQTTSTVTVSGASAVSLQLTPVKTTISKGATEQFDAIGIFSDNSTQDLTATSSFTSSSPEVASIDETGLAKGLSDGTTVITAVDSRTGLKGSSTLTVSGGAAQPVITDVSPKSLNAGDQCTITGTGFGSGDSSKSRGKVMFGDIQAQSYISWSDTLIVAVVPSGTSTGTISVTVTSQDGLASAGSTASQVSIVNNGNSSSAVPVSIDLTPSAKTIVKGATQQFTATGHFQDKTTQDITTKVTWTSSSESVASISSAEGKKGLATALSEGTASIKAAWPNSQITGSTSLTVKSAKLLSLSISPANPVLQAGKTQQLTATGQYDDSSKQDLTTLVTWSSSSAGCATVSNAQSSKGVITAMAAGSATITAVTPGASPVSGSTTLTVPGRKLVSIEITPSNPAAAAGTTVQLKATGHLDDSSTIDMTTSVTWSSDLTDVISVSAAGLARALTAGSAVITARDPVSTIGCSTTITVTASAGGFTSQTMPSQSCNIRGASFTDSMKGWLAGLAGLIVHTDDGGATWTAEDSGVTEDLYSVSFADSSSGWVAGAGGLIAHTADGGLTWSRQNSGVNSALRSICFKTAAVGWAAGDSSVIAHTDDGGLTWTAQDSGFHSQAINAIQFHDQSAGWAAGEGGMIVHTVDGGLTWTSQGNATASLYAICCIDSDNAWISGQNGTILHTSDGGITWDTQASGTTQTIYSISFGDALNGWAVTDSGQVMQTGDGGQNWQSHAALTTNSLYSAFFITADLGWLAGDGGTVLHTTTGGR